MPKQQWQQEKCRQPAVWIYGRWRLRQGATPPFSVEICQFMKRNLFQQGRNIDIFALAECVQDMRYATGAEHQPPVTALHIVRQTQGAGNVAPERRQAARSAPDAPAASGGEAKRGKGDMRHGRKKPRQRTDGACHGNKRQISLVCALWVWSQRPNADRRLGLKRRLVLILEWLTRLPTWGFLPQKSHSLLIQSSVYAKNSSFQMRQNRGPGCNNSFLSGHDRAKRLNSP